MDFYGACMESHFDRFTQDLGLSYAQDQCQDMQGLNEGLDYLEKVNLTVDHLKAIPSLTMIHGEKDQIAPFEEWIGALPELGDRLKKLEGKGHLLL